MEDYGLVPAARAAMIGAGIGFVETVGFDCVSESGETAVGASSGPFGRVSC